MSYPEKPHQSWFNEAVTNETVEYAEKFAKHLTDYEKETFGKNKTLTTSQLRKFFGEVKRQQIQQEQNGFDEASFVMLKPKLAYAVGRAKKKENGALAIEDFYDIISVAINHVNKCPNKEKAFKNFISFFEAVVAYHKAYSKE